VILALHHEQDIEKMGGLARRIRQTHFVFLVGVVAIAGFPPLSGFFSKDEILVATFASHVPGRLWLYAIGLGVAFLTSFYMFRLYYKVFHGECRAPAELREHIHEQPGIVVNPLWALAILSVFGGLFGFPLSWGEPLGVEDSHSLDNWLNKVVGYVSYHVPHSTEYAMQAVATGVALLGLLLARTLYLSRPALPARIAASAAGVQRLLANKYWVDELYDAIFVRPLLLLSERVFYRAVDAGLIDGLAVNGLGRTVRGVAAGGLKYLQTGLTQSYVFSMLVGAAAILWYLAR
jgi:NADH-quinone oxidoreductase subunit L